MYKITTLYYKRTGRAVGKTSRMLTPSPECSFFLFF